MTWDESNLPPSQRVHDAPLPESTQRVSQQRGISRRTILIGFAGLAGLASIGLIGDKLLQRSPQPFHSPPFAIYHDPSGTFITYYNASDSDHQAQINALSRQGYRITSLSIYGDAPLYAAVWVRRAGPAWREFHGIDAAQYQRNSDAWTRQGFRPIILSATGTRSNAIFAGIFIRDANSFIARYNLTSDFDTDPVKLLSESDQSTLEYWNKWAKLNGYMLRCITLYGNTTPLYAGIWEQNTGSVPWNWDSGFYDTAAYYQARLQAQAAQWTRPAFVTLSGASRYCSIFRDDSIGSQLARINMTGSDYLNTLRQLSAQQYYPIVVQGSGHGRKDINTRFAAIFAKQETPIPHQWTVTGKPIPSLSAFDDVMQRFMQLHNIRAGALAVVKDARLVFVRAYTWAEPGYPITQPTSLFRIASCSKPLTSIAIHQLIEKGALSLDTHIQDILKLKTPQGQPPVDPRFNDIQVQHVLSHLSGCDEDNIYSQVQYEVEIASAFGVPLPVTKYQLASYAASKPLQFDPGSQWVYSGTGYSLLGQIIEKLTGLGYIQAIMKNVFAPLGVTRSRLGRSLLSNQAPAEVRYHDPTPYVFPSVMTPDRPLVPYTYGGQSIELLDANAGWISTAPDYAKLLAAFDRGSANPLLRPAAVATMWTQMWPQQTPTGYVLRGWFKNTLDNGLTAIGHTGDLNGAATLIFRRSDNISFVAFFNKNPPDLLRMDDAGLGSPLNHAADAVTTWPTTDLFPSVAIPSFS